MKIYLFLAFFILSTLSLESFSQDETPPKPEVVDEANSPSENNDIEIIVSEKNTIDSADLYGPYSFSSLPKDVRDKLINGLDGNGQETVTQMLRRTSEQADEVTQGPPRLDVKVSTSTMGHRAVQLVRRVQGKSDGWSVRLRNRTLESVGGEKVKSREFWIFYKTKFN